MKKKIDYKKLYGKEEARATRWKVGFFVLLFVAGLVGSVSIYLVNDIDEDAFCESKLDKYFPEYDWNNVGYNSNGNCIGVYNLPYNGTIEKRDGLKENVEVKTAQKTYNLINKEDIEYLESDDITGSLWIWWCVLWFAAGVILSDRDR